MRKWLSLAVGVVCGAEVVVAVGVGGGLASVAGWEVAMVAGAVGFAFAGPRRAKTRSIRSHHTAEIGGSFGGPS